MFPIRRDGTDIEEGTCRMPKRSTEWHLLEKNPKDLPDLGERVQICVGYALVGEGWIDAHRKWFRYCDFAPIDEYMSEDVVAWAYFNEPPKKPKN